VGGQKLVAVPGQKYNCWTVRGKAVDHHDGPHQYWSCECDCGRVKDVRASAVVCGRSVGCGCPTTPQSAVALAAARAGAARGREAMRAAERAVLRNKTVAAEMQDVIGHWGLKKPIVVEEQENPEEDGGLEEFRRLVEPLSDEGQGDL
jgi:hypothetical protein